MAGWRDTARPILITGLGDARVMLPMVILLFFPSWIMFGICLLSIVLLMFLNYKGFTFMVFLRWMRSKTIGQTKLSRSTIQQRRMYGKASSSGASRWHR